MEQKTASHLRHIFSLPVIVTALDYFMDIYDIVLYSIVRVLSLKSFDLAGQELIDSSINCVP